MRKIGYFLLLAAVLITVGQVACYASQLPDPVASHFNAKGEVDGWTARRTFIALHVGVQLATAAGMVAVAEYGRFLPDCLYSMPHKKYWLHADRRDETLRYNGGLLILIAGLTTILQAAVFHSVYITNLPGRGDFPESTIWFLLVGYVVIVCALCGLALWKFGRLPEDARTEA